MTFRRGEPKPTNSGRKKGTVNKLTDEVAKLAKAHGPAAIARLNEIMNQNDDLRAAGSAAKELLERAYGRTSQVLGIDENQNKIKVVITGDDAKL